MAGRFVWRAGKYELAACVTGVGAEVKNPVGGFDYLKVMFDDDQAMAGIDETLENFEQDFYVLKMEAGRRFVKDEEGRLRAFFLGREFGEVAHEFEPLAFAAAQCVDWL